MISMGKKIEAGQLAKRVGVSRDILDLIFDRILVELREGNTVRIGSFGSFRPGVTSKRVFNSPVIPGGQAVCASRRCVRFRQGPGAKRALAEDGA